MVKKILSPGVELAEKADVCAKHTWGNGGCGKLLYEMAAV
jgi:hypothetical protein